MFLTVLLTFVRGCHWSVVTPREWSFQHQIKRKIQPINISIKHVFVTLFSTFRNSRHSASSLSAIKWRKFHHKRQYDLFFFVYCSSSAMQFFIFHFLFLHVDASLFHMPVALYIERGASILRFAMRWDSSWEPFGRERRRGKRPGQVIRYMLSERAGHRSQTMLLYTEYCDDWMAQVMCIEWSRWHAICRKGKNFPQSASATCLADDADEIKNRIIWDSILLAFVDFCLCQTDMQRHIKPVIGNNKLCPTLDWSWWASVQSESRYFISRETSFDFSLSV